jgi:hypothetical protein
MTAFVAPDSSMTSHSSGSSVVSPNTESALADRATPATNMAAPTVHSIDLKSA